MGLKTGIILALNFLITETEIKTARNSAIETTECIDLYICELIVESKNRKFKYIKNINIIEIKID